MSRRKKIVLLGATGSIGGNALRVIEHHADKLELVGIAARRRLDALAGIARAHPACHVGVFESSASGDRSLLSHSTPFYSGIEGICDLVRAADPDLVLVATSGTAALKPTLAAIEAGKNVALATKEILVLAGRFIAEAAHRTGVRLIPVDSEHNAIFQCLEGAQHGHMRRLVLTASGGAFRDTPLESLAGVTPREALAHPNWSMGDKVTIDSATMANKGLEIIEAHWLFDARPNQIDVVIHPQSIVHSMVEFVDGSFLAQLSPPSMTFAIQHALLYPERAPGVDSSLDLTQGFQLDFQPPDFQRYPCLGLAREALALGGTAPAVFNAANEIAVAAFLDEKIGFLEIPTIIIETMNSIPAVEPSGLDEVLQVESEARAKARQFAGH